KRLGAGTDGRRFPGGFRRHGYARAAAGCLLQGAARQGGGGGARSGAHHGQQERHSLRHQPADESERDPPGIARRHHARIWGAGNARGGTADCRGADEHRERDGDRGRAAEGGSADPPLPALRLEACNRAGVEWRTSSSMPAAYGISGSAPTSEAWCRRWAASTGPTSTPWSADRPTCARSPGCRRISMPRYTGATTTARWITWP